MSHPYGQEYYCKQCGPTPMGRHPLCFEFFRRIADHVIGRLRPRRVLDIGCAMGLLVEVLVDCGVDAYGEDISEYAISEARSDIRGRLQVRDVLLEQPATQPRYDLAITIEVAEHLPPHRAKDFIAYVCSQAPLVLFSSSPCDFVEPTHLNVRPTSYWTELFGEQGFRRVADAPFVTPWAGLYCREGHGHVSPWWLELRYKLYLLSKRGVPDFLRSIDTLLPLRRLVARLRGRSQ